MNDWKVPITPYNKRLYWPPDWIKRDCGELAKEVREKKKGDFFYRSGHYQCNSSLREYKKIDGRDQFVLINESQK